MSDQTSDSDLAGSTGQRARNLQPFEFLKGKPDQGVQTFQEFLAKRKEAPVHPSFQGDVPDPDADD